ncbi:MAG TPA: hypothetical protein VND92_03290, partial [Vicinamibacterales bacterium]|nr:hypothetical protein [Vicinamibacterales bacterium]
MTDSSDLDGMTPNMATASPGAAGPVSPAGGSGGFTAVPVSEPAATPAVGRDRTEDNRVAADLKGLVARGALTEARDLFSSIVKRHQRRASRIAYHYL